MWGGAWGGPGAGWATPVVEEICAKAKLEIHYGALLEQVVTRIEAGGCEVMTREDGIPSSYDPCTEPPIIRVNVKNVETPFKVFWDLLHEFGHHLSGKRQAEDETLEREELPGKRPTRSSDNIPTSCFAAMNMSDGRSTISTRIGPILPRQACNNLHTKHWNRILSRRNGKRGTASRWSRQGRTGRVI